MPDWSALAPCTEAVWRELSAQRLRAIEEIDAERLALERSRRPPHAAAKLGEPVYTVRNRYRFWESLIRRMEDGWAPDGYYVIEEYINDLETRDGIDRVPAERAEF